MGRRGQPFLLLRLSDICDWHTTTILEGGRYVRYRGKSGHANDMAEATAAQLGRKEQATVYVDAQVLLRIAPRYRTRRQANGSCWVETTSR